MLVRVTWINGSETDLDIETLRDLDRFVGDHTSGEITADLKPLPDADGLRLVFAEASARAA